MNAHQRSAQVRAWPLLSAALLLASCGGNGGGSGTVVTPAPTPTPAPTATPTPAGPEAGAIVSISDAAALEIRSAGSNALLTIEGASQTAGARIARTDSGSGTAAVRWHALPMGNNRYNIESLLTHQVMGIEAASTAEGALAVQWADNGTDDHLWSFYRLSNGNYLIRNVNSGLYLQVGAGGAITQGARATSGQEWAITVTGDRAYPEPAVLAGAGIDVHDPDLLQDASGTIWLYGTHNTLARSTDGALFLAETRPIISPDFSWWASKNTTWQGRTDIWAPSILHANGTYYLYYSIPIYNTPSQAGTNNGAQALIALATSTSPNGPWTDAGTIIESCGNMPGCTTTFNAIDPAPFIGADGRWWMAFGSWEDGIHVLELDPATGLRLQSNSALPVIAFRGAGQEGPFVLPRVVNGQQWYYYFGSNNPCCSASSTYRVVVGRSASPTGPFLDRGGIDLRDGGGTILLGTHGYVVGPGGQSVREIGGQLKLVYHFYDSRANGAPKLGLNTIAFDAEGWPYLQ